MIGFAGLSHLGLVSSVAVVAQVSENPSDYKAGLWDKVIGAYDYQALGASVDFVSLMSYEQRSIFGMRQSLILIRFLKHVTHFLLH